MRAVQYTYRHSLNPISTYYLVTRSVQPPDLLVDTIIPAIEYIAVRIANVSGVWRIRVANASGVWRIRVGDFGIGVCV